MYTYLDFEELLILMTRGHGRHLYCYIGTMNYNQNIELILIQQTNNTIIFLTCNTQGFMLNMLMKTKVK